MGYLTHVWGSIAVIVVAATNWWARECWGSWIVVSSPGSKAKLPSCPSYCLQEYSAWPVLKPGLMAGLWWCGGSPRYTNEQWSFDASSSVLFLKDDQGAHICLDIGDPSAYNISSDTPPSGSNRSLILTICDSSSPTQRWAFDEAGRLTSHAGRNPSYAHAYQIVKDKIGFYLYLQEDTKSAQSFVIVNDIAPYYTPALPTDNETNLILNGNLKLLTSFGPVTTQPPLDELWAGENYVEWVKWPMWDGSYFILCHWEMHGNLRIAGCNTTDTYCELPQELCSGTNANEVLLFLNSKEDNGPGSIMQAVPTYPGSNYLLLFETRNPFNQTQKVKLSVSHVLNSTAAIATQEFAISPNQTESQTKQFQFIASGNFVNVSFASLNPSGCGPLINNIQLYYWPQSDNVRSAGTPKLIFVFTIFAGGVLAAALCSGVAFYIACNLQRKRRSKTIFGSSASTTATQITVFSYEQLKAYTQNFSILVGEGGFGKVYFGRLPESPHQAIAVKRQNDTDDASFFQAEVALLSRVHHRYIVKFLGYCEDKGERMLVFEFMANKSLHSRLHGELMLDAPLSWAERIRIAYQVAYALEYLHNGANPPVLHRDVKAANVLLSDTLVAKLADLGISKAGRPNESEGPRSTATMTAVKGSRGYLDPYYLQTNMFSHKSDVYSFGVLLLEMVTGQKAITDDFELLTAWAKHNYWDDLPSSNFGGSREQHILDNRLHGTVRDDNVKAVMEIARSCLYEEPRQRPCMEEVARRLREQLASCTVARLHTDEFYMGTDAQATPSSSSSYDVSSISGR